ncbi:MAG: hypothetical protein HKN25_01740 [Pyrinomonadaceae bacterium]|nr:hypothetical protein [Pyrinomonadaceae bacterium]
MNKKKKENEARQKWDFTDAADTSQPGFFREFLDFLLHNKKWWITPIVVGLVLVGMLIMLGGTAAGPFLYPLF